VLADFRAWLREAAVPAEEPPPAEPPDWSAVLQQWVALRQEVNLQTRASRAQLEQNAQALDELARAVDTLHSAPEPAAGDENIRPLLKALVDAYDALALGRREVQRLSDSLPAKVESPPEPRVALPAWARWLGLGAAVEKALGPVRAWCRERDAAELQGLRQKVEAVLVGYQMGLQRLERVLEQQGLEPIEAVGRPFDPEEMEVVEVVRDAGRSGTEVLDEVRRGYRWQGRVFRFAQVRVARP